MSFAVHPEFKSHTGTVMTMGSGAMQSLSRKQQLNCSRSSMEAELIAVDNAATCILWTKLFMEEQGYSIKDNMLFQDNKSAILLEKNSQSSAGKQSRAIAIRHYCILDQIQKGNVCVEYMSTDEMIGDFSPNLYKEKSFTSFGH